MHYPHTQLVNNDHPVSSCFNAQLFCFLLNSASIDRVKDYATVNS